MTAGARATAISAPNGYFIQKIEDQRKDFQNLISKIEYDIDLFITESRSRGVLPTLMLDRGFAAPEIDARVTALFQKDAAPHDGLLSYDLDDMETAARITLFLMGRPLYGADGIMFLTM